MKREDLEEWLNTKWLDESSDDGRDRLDKSAAKNKAANRRTGGLVIAEQQTSGQGRRTWLDFPSGRKYLYDDAPASCI